MIVNPKDYFVASNELVVIALVVCWAITAAVDIDKAWSHPAQYEAFSLHGRLP